MTVTGAGVVLVLRGRYAPPVTVTTCSIMKFTEWQACTKRAADVQMSRYV